VDLFQRGDDRRVELHAMNPALVQLEDADPGAGLVADDGGGDDIRRLDLAAWRKRIASRRLLAS